MVWELSKGHLRLRKWARNFDPFKENSPLANVWVRIHYLPIEYWNPQVISGIGRFLGHHLKIDRATVGREFGQFARILVEMDMSHNPPSSLLIDRGDISFYVEFVFENLPLYCDSCKITSHAQDTCRKKRRVEPASKIDSTTVEGVPELPDPKTLPGTEWQVVERGKKHVASTDLATGAQQRSPGNSFAILSTEEQEIQQKQLQLQVVSAVQELRPHSPNLPAAATAPDDKGDDIQ
ncbi:uncharacterized protein LOC131025796 [Salvia miltiorrhiza]|uniref:uncharacterized protein LOC131025796 n=1 Tax=Salvia miltiorrhiza TaxID=226208 RepID=UPI0025AC20CC|nr:uncharacterized protein LOC131025796 [Salvia miltiorrhiza]